MGRPNAGQMTTSTSRSSQPPPEPPSTIVAQTRIRALQATLEAEPEPGRKCILQYEIAALTEHKLGDAATAAKLYLAAYNLSSNFRPPLYALARLFESIRSFTNLERVYRAALRSAADDRERASALTNLALLLHDHQQKPAEAIEMLEQALALDPASGAAALMLERCFSKAGDHQAAERLIRRRAEQVCDPGLKAELLKDVSTFQQAQGRIDEAIDSARQAAELSGERWYALERLERLARAHDRPETAVQAIEARAEIANRYAQNEAEARDLACSLPVLADLRQARESSAALWREAGRLRLARLDDKQGAVAAYQRALALYPDDVLLRQEQMLACELNGDLEQASEQARFLLQGDLPAQQRALLHFSLAEFARARGDTEAARQLLVQAGEVDPESVAVAAALERLLIDTGQFERLVADLEQRASTMQGRARAETLWRAGQIAADRLDDDKRGLDLLDQAVEALSVAVDQPADTAPLLREAFAIAYRTGNRQRAERHARSLEALQLEPDEQGALLSDLYQMVSSQAGEQTGVDEALAAALANEACSGWAPDVLRVRSALQKDYRLLARAHEALAADASSPEAGGAAHLCAAARALVLAGDEQGAFERLERALELSPADTYAVSLLEEILMARGEADRVVTLLRNAADAQQNVGQSKLALLQAGVAAEAAGNQELAIRSYEDAIDRDPNAFGPLWMLRRLAERNDDETLLLTALEGLTLRERNLGPPSYATLELGQRYEVTGNTDLITDPLLAATTDRNTGTAAAISLALQPGHIMDPQDRLAVLDQLKDTASDRLATVFLREKAATLLCDDLIAASNAVSDLLDDQPDDRWARCASIFLAPDQTHRAQAFVDLGKATEDREASVDLMFHGLRAYSLARGSESADDVLMLALSIAQASSSSIEAAVAVSESLAGGDDAETRAEAFDKLLTHATDSARPSIASAFARALVASGRHEEAVRVADKRVAEDPKDLSAWEVLRVAQRARQSWPDVVRACDRLAEKCQGKYKSMLLEESAEGLLAHLEDDDRAEVKLREVLRIDPASDTAFDLLHDLLVRRDDTPGLLALITSRIDITNDTSETVDLFYEQARLLRAAGDRLGALDTLDTLLTLNPVHAGALGLAAEIHASLERWPEAVATLRKLAETALTAEHKRMAHIGAAEFLERKFDDHQAAYQELDKLVELDLADVTVHAKMAGLALRKGDHLNAVTSLALASASSEGEQRAAYERLAGQIYFGNLGDTEQAVAAYRGALLASPADEQACQALSELVVDPVERQELIQGFEKAVRSELDQRSRDPVLLRKLRKAAAFTGERDVEYLVLDALDALGLASVQEHKDRQLILDDTQRSIAGKLTATGTTALRVPGEIAGPVEAAVALSEVAMTVFHIEPVTYSVGRANRVSDTPFNPLRQELKDILDVFGLQLSALYSGGDDSTRIAAIPAPGASHCWVLGKEVSAPLSAEQRFSVGQQAMALRLGIFPLVIGRSESEALQLFRAAALAVDRSAAEPAGGEDLSALVRQLDKAITRKTRKILQGSLPRIVRDEPALAAYLGAVHQSCRRAGLFIGGELGAVLKALLGAQPDAEAVGGSPTALDLLAFWISRPNIALRRELGMAL